MATDHRAYSYAQDILKDRIILITGASDGIGRDETLARLERVYGRLPELRSPSHFQSDACASVLDSNRARDRLGWEPNGDWDSILDKHRTTSQKEHR